MLVISRRSLFAVALFLGAPLPCAWAAGEAVPSSAIPILVADQLHPGQKAVVRTVFSGSKIEEFDAEIVGVLQGGRTEGDLILGRATSERVVKSGIAQGMSGSPVYVDGKLIGALSSAWSFSREPLFGITPIKEMLEVLDHRNAGPPEPTAGPAGVEVGGPNGRARFREFRWDDEDESPPAEAGLVPGGGLTGGPTIGPTVPSGPSPGMARLALPLACGGLHPGAFESVRQWLLPFGLDAVPAGLAPRGGPAASALQPGAAVAVEVMRGDLQLSAIGTVTYRDGDRVLLFGHPFFQSGDVRLPLATAEITTIVASEQLSFKLGVRGRTAGVATQDRRTAVAGHIGGDPRMLPLSIGIAGARAQPQSFHFETIEDRTLAPSLVAIATLNSLLESGGGGANQTLRWSLTLHRPGAAPLRISDVTAGDSPPGELLTNVTSPLRFLFNNPFERMVLDSIEVAVRIDPGRDQWTLRSARVLDAAVRPGRPVRIQCEIERWRSGRELREFSLVMPEEAPEGRYTLWLGGAAELTRYESSRLPARYRPTSLDDAWRRLAAMRSTEGLYAALFARAPEITSEGRDYPELPLSALSVWSSEQGTGDRARRGDVAKLDEARVPVPGQVRGELVLNVLVDDQAP